MDPSQASVAVGVVAVTEHSPVGDHRHDVGTEWRGVVDEFGGVDGLVPGARDIGYVPQDRALFPGLAIYRQLAFALEIRRQAADVIARRVEELAHLLGIEKLLDRMPSHLSGGEAQRVALGRALAAKPQALLLDEPLSNLDVTLHDDMCELLQHVHRETRVTVLHVTHHPAEAAQLGTEVFSMEDGHMLKRAEGSQS